ncbi:MAG: MBL fold metallo-hydrolase, partial [Bacteroidota bacterium]
MNIQKFIFSPFQENTFVIWDEVTKDTCIIDPGCYNSNEEETLKKFIESNELNVKYLINTHCHIDHIFGNSFVKTEFNPIFLAPEYDVPLLKMAIEQGKQFGIKVNPSSKPDDFIEETNTINIGNIELQFIFTPGHTPGEYCIYNKTANCCFTGDVLFR